MRRGRTNCPSSHYLPIITPRATAPPTTNARTPTITGSSHSGLVGSPGTGRFDASNDWATCWDGGTGSASDASLAPGGAANGSPATASGATFATIVLGSA